MNEASEETKEELQNTTKPHDAPQSPARNEKPLETPDVGIFSVNPMISNQGSSLEGFCATFKKAHATRNKSVREHNKDDEEETCTWQHPTEQEDKKKDNGVNECNDMPAAKKQCTTYSCNPSPFLKCHSDILQNVYSFLTLKEAVVLRRTCHDLHQDCNMFCFSIIDGSIHPITRPGGFCTNKQELALYNLKSAANVRALFRNETLPAHIVKDYIQNLIFWSTTDNGEAVSVALQDGRCLVEPSMLDKALRKDYTAMAAALQQDETVRAAIQMCCTCHARIGIYTCFKFKHCKNLSPQAKLGDSNLPKYCKGCTLASNMLFCKCGEAVCRNKCSVTVPSCVECLAMTCGQAECILEECDECGEFLCLSCTPECGPCYRMNGLFYLDSYLFSDDYYNEYYGYDHDSDYSY
jgi:hypothetical protein